MNYIVLDLETYDPWIDQGRGSGWPEKQAKFLCAAARIKDTMCYFTNMDMLQRNLVPGSTIIAHNAQYEAGILHSYGFDIESVTWIDTMILAKLYYNNLLSFSLDALAKTYLGEDKQDGELGEIAKELGLVKTIAQDPVKIAKKNMNLIFEHSPETVKKYVISDVSQTHKLFKFFMYDDKGVQRFTQDVIDFHSDLIKGLTLARARGVRAHIPTAIQVKKELLAKKDAADQILKKDYPKLNVQSSKQLAEYFDKVGVEYPKTDKGNPSITKQFMETLDHPLGQLVTEAKKYEKYVRDFIDPLLELSEPIDMWGHRANSSFRPTTDNQKYLRVYPEIKIYGAAATGRGSCANPNLQQIPKRDPDGALVRKIYHPEDGETWYSLDFSSQEPRLQVHYAAKLGAKGANELVEAFRSNPKHDLHQQVADLAQITRKEAKTINLGLAYGMGDNKLSESLKLSFPDTVSLRKRFNRLVPFLYTVDNFSKRLIKERGYLITLGGRKLYNETGFERKALNKLIQGGAADQTWTALVELYRAGIKFMFPVHDSIECSLKTRKEAEKVKQIMETCVPLLVPSFTDIESGPNWGELSK